MLPRDASIEQLDAAVLGLTSGLVMLADPFAEALLPTPSLEALLPPLEDLTPRENDVLQLLAEGLANKAIARRLDISEHTVKFHVNAIMSKLGASSRTQAVVRATRAGLIVL
jgi:DNA-binding NarL/FixJ family response regulator